MKCLLLGIIFVGLLTQYVPNSHAFTRNQSIIIGACIAGATGITSGLITYFGSSSKSKKEKIKKALLVGFASSLVGGSIFAGSAYLENLIKKPIQPQPDNPQQRNHNGSQNPQQQNHQPEEDEDTARAWIRRNNEEQLKREIMTGRESQKQKCQIGNHTSLGQAQIQLPCKHHICSTCVNNIRDTRHGICCFECDNVWSVRYIKDRLKQIEQCAREGHDIQGNHRILKCRHQACTICYEKWAYESFYHCTECPSGYQFLTY